MFLQLRVGEAFKLKSRETLYWEVEQKMVGFLQRSSDPSQPGRALDKKNSKIQIFFYVFIIFIITKFGENFEDKIDICFFWNVLRGKVKVKKSE